MPYPLQPFVDARGEPNRTALRWLFLTALRQEVPGVLPDLWESCIEPARAVLATAGPHDAPGHLLCWVSRQEAAQRRAEIAALRAQHGSDPLRDRLHRRAEARVALVDALTEWGSGYRLTNSAGTRNRWLLGVALDTLGAWCAAYPSASAQCPPSDLDWRFPVASASGHAHAAREYRRRAHPEPPPGAALGALARDWVWLLNYVCLLRSRHDFAPSVAPATVAQQVRAAAEAIGFELPDPLRPPSDSEDNPNH